MVLPLGGKDGGGEMKRAVQILLVLAVLVAGGIVYFLQSDAGKGMAIGVNYTARTLCSCIFVQGKEQGTCYPDMMGAVESMPVVIDTETQVVSVNLFGLLKGKATHVEGRGCYLD